MSCLDLAPELNYSHQHTSCQEQGMKLCLAQSSCFSCSHDFVPFAEIFLSKSVPLTFVNVRILKILTVVVLLACRAFISLFVGYYSWLELNWWKTFHCKRLIDEPEGSHWKCLVLSSLYQIPELAPKWLSRDSWWAQFQSWVCGKHRFIHSPGDSDSCFFSKFYFNSG